MWCGAFVQFYTITLGANPEFATETFYMENMEEDGRRVERLFHDASNSGIRVEVRVPSRAHLSSCPAPQFSECLRGNKSSPGSKSMSLSRPRMSVPY